MRGITEKLRNQRGTSFLEVIIALAIMGVVSATILSLYVTQHKHYLVQEDISDIQHNSRASIDEIIRNVRMAGHRLPAGLQAIAAANTNPDTITLTFQAKDCETYLSAAMPQPSAELKCGSDLSCFQDGQIVYIYQPDSGYGEWLEITQVQVAAFHLQHNKSPLSRAYDANSLILSLTQVKFYVDNTTDPLHPRLMQQSVGRPAQVFADNISDLQCTYYMKNGSVADVPVIVDNVREVMISITGRSDQPDIDQPEGQQYRIRVYSSSVNVRNIGS